MAGFAVMASSPASAEIVCVSGKVTSIEFIGYDKDSHNPWIYANVGGTMFRIAMKYQTGKSVLEMSSYLYMLSQAYLTDIPVEITTNKSSCNSNYLGEAEIRVVLKAR